MLRETGEFVGSDHAPAAGPVSSRILISRALCRFRFLPVTPGMSRQEAVRAAFLVAEGHAPFPTADFAVFRQINGFIIWWWDSARVRALVGPRYDARLITPESMVYAGDDGWRVVQSADGFEAQYIERGDLRHSLWRRRPFDDAQWRAFVDTAGASDTPAPETAPTPVFPTWRGDLSWRSKRANASAIWTRVEQASWIGAAAALVLCAGLLTHGLRYRDMALADHAAIERMHADSKARAVASRATKDAALVRAAALHAVPPEHLIAVADMLTEMRTAGLEPTAWRAEPGRLRASSLADGSVRAEELGARLEANPRLRDVAPYRDDEVIVVTARVEDTGAALADGAP